MNVTAKSIKAKGCVIYNVVVEDGASLELPDGTVYTNVFMPDKKLVMQSTVDTDGGKVFKTKLDANPHSFNEIYELNKNEDVSKCYAMGRAANLAADSPGTAGAACAP